MNKPVFSYDRIAELISEKSQKLLRHVDVSTVSDVFDAVKELVEIAVEKYSFRMCDYWKSVHADDDIACRIKFTDVNTGYEIMLKKWVGEHPFKADLPAVPQSEADSYEAYAARLRRKAVATAAVGTVGVGVASVKGWFIFGNPIVAIAVELIGIALTYATVQQKQNAKRREIALQLQQLKVEQEAYKKQLIDALTLSAKIWLQQVEKQSEELLKTF